MKTGDIIAASFVVVFALATLLLLVPRFAKHARWLPQGVPMSLRSRLLFPIFPILVALIAFDVVRALSIVLALLAWLAGFLSYLADRRRFQRERTHDA